MPDRPYRARNWHCRIEMWGCWPINFTLSWAHWTPNGTRHGPQSNPRLIAARFIDCRKGYLSRPPSDTSVHRLWIYVRGGYAFFFDLAVDRRT